MEFDVKRRKNPNVENYPQDDLKLAYDFSKRIYDEFGQFLKAVVLFGSAARKEESEKGDVDILVIIDDTTIVLTEDITEAYRVIVEKIIVDVSPKLHVTSLKLSSFWEYVRAGDPVAINLLRDGVSLLDTGFFDPLQMLLMSGRIRPTDEAIWNYFERAPKTLYNSRWHLLQASIDLYWAVIDAAHAALMSLGEIPPSPDHVADLMDEKMVKPKLIDKKYAETMQKFYKTFKMIMHREMKDMQGQEYEKMYTEAVTFVNEMQKFINKKKQQ